MNDPVQYFYLWQLYLYDRMLGPVGRPAPLEGSADPASPPTPPQVHTAWTLTHHPQAGQALTNAQAVQALTKWIIWIPSQTLHPQTSHLQWEHHQRFQRDCFLTLCHICSQTSWIETYFISCRSRRRLKGGLRCMSAEPGRPSAWRRLPVAAFTHSTYTRTRTETHCIRTTKNSLMRCFFKVGQL